jgi:serine/threonine-protein kinase
MDVAAQLSSALTGRYVIDREIGAGGMATVYPARDVRHDRRVAHHRGLVVARR